MGFLESTDQYISDYDDFTIVPWKFEDDFVKPWDKVAESCRYRKFVDKTSRAASRKRLSTIIYSNAKYLNGSKKTDKGVLTRRFLEHWILACNYLVDNHKDDAEGLEIMGQRYTITMGPFQFLTPDISNIVHLSGLWSNCPDALRELDVDRKRRMLKKEILAGYESEWRNLIRRMSYRISDPEKLKDLQSAVSKGIASIEDEIDYLSDS